MRCRVVYDYDAQEDGELTLNRGDVIIIENADDHGWWGGRNGRNRGSFPSNYVTVLYTNTLNR